MKKQWHSCTSLLTPTGRPLAASRCVSELQSWEFRCLMTKGTLYSFDHLGLPWRNGRNYDEYICQKDLKKLYCEVASKLRGLCGIVMTDGKITVSEVRICAEKLSNDSFRVDLILTFV